MEKAETRPYVYVTCPRLTDLNKDAVFSRLFCDCRNERPKGPSSGRSVSRGFTSFEPDKQSYDFITSLRNPIKRKDGTVLRHVTAVHNKENFLPRLLHFVVATKARHLTLRQGVSFDFHVVYSHPLSHTGSREYLSLTET